MSMGNRSNEAIEEGRALSFHLYEEAGRALRSWAVIEARRLAQEPWRAGYRAFRPRDFSLGEALHDIEGFALRDALMTLARMTDPPNEQMTDPPNKKLTLFELPGLLADSDLVTELGRSHGGADFQHALAFVRSRCLWDKRVKIKDVHAAQDVEDEGKFCCGSSLMVFRAELQRFRNAMLAHAGDRADIGGIMMYRFRIMMLLCTSATVAAMRVFRGHNWQAKADFWKHLRSQIELQRAASNECIHYSASPFVERAWRSRWAAGG